MLTMVDEFLKDDDVSKQDKSRLKAGLEEHGVRLSNKNVLQQVINAANRISLPKDTTDVFTDEFLLLAKSITPLEAASGSADAPRRSERVANTKAANTNSKLSGLYKKYQEWSEDYKRNNSLLTQISEHMNHLFFYPLVAEEYLLDPKKWRSSKESAGYLQTALPRDNDPKKLCHLAARMIVITFSCFPGLSIASKKEDQDLIIDGFLSKVHEQGWKEKIELRTMRDGVDDIMTKDLEKPYVMRSAAILQLKSLLMNRGTEIGL